VFAFPTQFVMPHVEQNGVEMDEISFLYFLGVVTMLVQTRRVPLLRLAKMLLGVITGGVEAEVPLFGLERGGVHTQSFVNPLIHRIGGRATVHQHVWGGAQRGLMSSVVGVGTSGNKMRPVGWAALGNQPEILQ
jgi:hypothetical protein